MMTTDNRIIPSDFQNNVLTIPEDYDMFLGGGRGGGKSYCLALIILRHLEQYKERARILYCRQTYPGLRDFESITREIFGGIYGTQAKYNSQDHCWRLPGNGYFELGQLETESDYQKYQGRSFSLLIVDEAGQFAIPDLLDRLRSNLRAPSGMKPRMILCANPGGVGHQWLAKRFVFAASPWTPFKEEQSGRTFVYCPSTYKDNDHLDQSEYRRNLEASCPYDPELLKAWTDGDWAIARGAFFGMCLDEKRNCIEPWESLPGLRWESQDRMRFWGDVYLAHDFGIAAPSVTLLMVESDGREGPDGRWYPNGSILVLDEFASNEPGNLTRGMGYGVDVLADRIKEMCKSWGGVYPSGVADDACFARSGMASIAEEFRRHGVYFRPSRKGDRRTGWEKLRRLMADAGKLDVPGLYIARNCEYLWATLPYLARDPRKPDDLDTRGADHGADALRYGVLRRKFITTVTNIPTL
jgi:hypothetical protein